VTAKMVRILLVHHLSCLASVDSTGGDTVAVPLETGLTVMLDEDHAPETNGRMAVCRRCGFRTVATTGESHAPTEANRTKATQWLDGRVLANRVVEIRSRMGR
jgi:hypothetical protein